MEIWKPIPGYEGIYEVSDLGRVKSLPRLNTSGGILVPNRLERNGKLSRLQVRLSRDGKPWTVGVHRLVALAFIGPANGRLVRHLDDNPENNVPLNLAYGTHQDNMQDKIANGGGKGSKHPKSKLTELTVLKLKTELLTRTDYSALASEYGVSVQTVQSIKHGRNWGWLKLN